MSGENARDPDQGNNILRLVLASQVISGFSGPAGRLILSALAVPDPIALSSWPVTILSSFASSFWPGLCSTIACNCSDEANESLRLVFSRFSPEIANSLYPRGYISNLFLQNTQSEESLNALNAFTRGNVVLAIFSGTGNTLWGTFFNGLYSVCCNGSQAFCLSPEQALFYFVGGSAGALAIGFAGGSLLLLNRMIPWQQITQACSESGFNRLAPQRPSASYTYGSINTPVITQMPENLSPMEHSPIPDPHPASLTT